MSAQVSNVGAGDDNRQASAAPSADGGRKDDKRDGRKPPRKNPSRVGKVQAAKRCYICNKPGHLKKNCPLAATMTGAYSMLTNQLVQVAMAPRPHPRANSGPRRSHRPTPRSLRYGEDRARQRENQIQLDARGENGAEQQQQQQVKQEDQQQQQDQQEQVQMTLPERGRDWADDDKMDT